MDICKLNAGGAFEHRHGYSRLVMVDNWIFMALSAGIIPETGLLPDDPVQQAEQALSNIEHSLKTVGSELSDIVRLVVSIPNREDIMPIQDCVGNIFRGIDPAMSLYCTPLGSDKYRVEFEATAYKHSGRAKQRRLNSNLFNAPR